jgi:N-acetylglucosaminyl-diphospho-decaprenol L-rhamnosyltransferase
MKTMDSTQVNLSAIGRPGCGPTFILSVIIVSFNTRELTLAAIDAVLRQLGSDGEIIVVDNASTDGSASAIARDFPQVNLLALDDNIGFARANNLAAKQARGRLLLLLNPDTLLQPGAIAAMLDFARRRPDARIWGGRTLRPDGRPDPRSCARRPSLWSVFSVSVGLASLFPGSTFCNPEAMPNWGRDDERDVDIVIGCFLMIGRSDWQSLHGFDPAFFMYGEEVDLCLRARAIGARPAICPEARIIHFDGASQDAAPRMVQVLAARILNCRRHLPRGQSRLAVGFIRYGVLLRLILYHLIPGASQGRERLRRVYRMRRAWWSGYG